MSANASDELAALRALVAEQALQLDKNRIALEAEVAKRTPSSPCFADN
ncbi:hypothetical protein [Asticcacaulis excentricus]|nr:hypothetical protein [Asticcacaulis excentricus]